MEVGRESQETKFKNKTVYSLLLLIVHKYICNKRMAMH